MIQIREFPEFGFKNKGNKSGGDAANIRLESRKNMKSALIVILAIFSISSFARENDEKREAAIRAACSELSKNLLDADAICRPEVAAVKADHGSEESRGNLRVCVQSIFSDCVQTYSDSDESTQN